jgi:hypothetical protein
VIRRPAKKNPGGRPSRAEGPRLPYDELDKLLVHGEVVELEDGSVTVEFPSYRDLAERFNVAASVIGDYAKRHNVKQRRKGISERVQHRVEEKLVELRADAVSVTRDDQLRMVDRYLLKFAKAIEEDRVRFDTISDLNIAMRLKEFLLGNAESRSEVHNLVLKLDELQDRHREAVRRVEVTTAAERGEVPKRLPEATDATFKELGKGEQPVVVEAEFEPAEKDA